MSYIYNLQSSDDWASASKVNALSAALGRITNVGLYPFKNSRYVVAQIGSTYYVFDGRSGQRVSTSVNASTAIQWALDNATSGRTWKERTKLVGTFDLDARVTVPNYTTLRRSSELW